MENTLVPTNVTQSSTADVDLFGHAAEPKRATSTAIVSRTGKTVGTRITFNTQVYKDFCDNLKASKLTHAEQRKIRQDYFHADEIERLRMYGRVALERSYKACEEAPLGYVPDAMELRKNTANLKLVSVSVALGHKTATDKQKLADAEKEVARLKALLAEKQAAKDSIEADAAIVVDTPTVE